LCLEDQEQLCWKDWRLGVEVNLLGQLPK
jgi:hypothetical protein